MENKEEWRAIKGYEGLYEVSNTGRVRTIKKGSPYVLKMYDKFGYKDVMLWKNNKMKNKRVHRLVAEAFIPNPNLYPIINHKDENPLNNSVWNLEWCTAKYNSTYGRAQDWKFKPIKMINTINKDVKLYKSIAEASKDLNIPTTTIVNVLHRNSTMKNGLDFKYI